MAHSPYASAQAVSLILNTVRSVFSDFTYHRQLAAGEGLGVVLAFSASFGDKALKGIDLIQFDAAGLIVDFEVMVRPLIGLQALGAEMGATAHPTACVQGRNTRVKVAQDADTRPEVMGTFTRSLPPEYWRTVLLVFRDSGWWRRGGVKYDFRLIADFRATPKQS